jgi:hypothetical protein
MGQTGASTLSPTRGATSTSREAKPAERRGDNEHHVRYLEIHVDDHDASGHVEVEPVVPRVEADGVQPNGEGPAPTCLAC